MALIVKKKKVVKNKADSRNTKKEDRTHSLADNRKRTTMISEYVHSFVYSNSSVTHLQLLGCTCEKQVIDCNFNSRSLGEKRKEKY